jgi:CHAT domain-containing protein
VVLAPPRSAEPAGLGRSLVTLPTLAVLRRPRSSGLQRGRQVALVVGNPSGDLSDAELESREVASLLGTDPLVGSRATRQAVMDALPDASIIHIATHGWFLSGSPLDSHLTLSDGRLSVREILAQRIQAEMLVLSGCETGLAGAMGGEELAGLAHAFLYAGAASVVVSLWRVDDPATCSLMTRFHSELQSGLDKDVALMRAMADVRSQPEWSHPSYWAPFVLMGDWRS